jgi:DNA repair exonuclease SbcCD nuclease subunit
MSGMTQFIHTADVHLGYVQYGLHQRFIDFGRAFSQVVSYAIENDVDFVLISGDLFHKRNINALTYLQAYELLSRLKGIPVFVIEGNHDLAYFKDRHSWLEALDRQGLITLLKTHEGTLSKKVIDVG